MHKNVQSLALVITEFYSINIIIINNNNNNNIFPWFAITCFYLIFRRVRKIAKSDFSVRRVRPSVHMEQLGSHWMDFMKFDILELFENMSRRFKFH